jgi:ABC-type proline/glycine betaine transport system permease subunit
VVVIVAGLRLFVVVPIVIVVVASVIGRLALPFDDFLGLVPIFRTLP